MCIRDSDKAALAEVTVRRLKRDTDKGFLARQILTIPFEPDPADERAFTQLEALLTAAPRPPAASPLPTSSRSC